MSRSLVARQFGIPIKGITLESKGGIHGGTCSASFRLKDMLKFL